MNKRSYTDMSKNTIMLESNSQADEYFKDHTRTETVDKLIDSLYQNLYAYGIFINVSKAIDSINPTILLTKL